MSSMLGRIEPLEEIQKKMTDKKAKSAADRKKEERKRKRNSGLVPKEIWCKPDDWEKIRKYVDKLNK